MIADPPPPDTATPSQHRRISETGWILLAAPLCLAAGFLICALIWVWQANRLDSPIMSARLMAQGAQLFMQAAFVALVTWAGVRHLRRINAADTERIVRKVLREEIEALLAEPGEKIAGELGRIKDRVYLRPDDDPHDQRTVPIRPTVPHVVGVASPGVYGQRVDSAIERAAERAAEHVAQRIEEMGAQRYFKGYADCAEDMSGGSVVALAPRNGRSMS